ncbi:MAG: Dam family site-specific DNA-(adenine-N6)-methyltransferase [Xanthobacteraceae bacterium]|nr:Dam family site-specific DNA-(adenine-N6)-methyltransferase [Xanthobacteraceae bacterium]
MTDKSGSLSLQANASPNSPTNAKPSALNSSKPFLRWAGSKRKQLGRLRTFWSARHVRYVEPFAGSACLFFELAPPGAVLGDSNRDLIEVYRVVQQEPERLYNRLCRIRRDRPTYMRWRALSPMSLDRETRALRFLYLNRNCFNGIYRTNVAGQFNVPMGRRPGAYFTKEDLVRCSELLEHATLVAGDFAKTLKHVKAGDFVYLDPPYAVTSRRIFRQYGKDVFNIADIPRFADCLAGIAQVGADFLVSYADCREARHLASQWNSVRLPVRRHVAGFSGARKNAYEWLITNLPLDRTNEARS